MVDRDVLEVASELHVRVGALVRVLRQRRAPDDPTPSETAVLARLDREGPATSAELARREQISPQSMGVTIASLAERGFVERTAHPNDGRRVVVSLTDPGAEALAGRRNQRTHAIADAMAETLTPDEIAVVAAALPLLDRLTETL